MPARLDGMGLVNPTEGCLNSHSNSEYVTEPLVRLMLKQESLLEPMVLLDEVKLLRKDVDKRNEERNQARLGLIIDAASPELKIALKANGERSFQLGNGITIV